MEFENIFKLDETAKIIIVSYDGLFLDSFRSRLRFV